MSVGRRELLATALGVMSAGAAATAARAAEGARTPGPPVIENGGRVFDPKSFGARGDGVADDTDAINAMLAAMHDGDVAEFPRGTYLVRPRSENDYILRLPDKEGITVRGIARSSATIRIANEAGNYLGLLGRRGGERLSNLAVTQLTFDHNQAGNRLGSEKDYTRLGRYTVGLYPNGNTLAHHVVDDIAVVNCDSVVSIYMPQGFVRHGSVIVRNSRWLFLDNAIGENYDQSILNVAGDQIIISGNLFRGAGWGRGCPRTCIETHGANQVIVANTISNAQVGMNLTGISRPGVDLNVLCVGNVIEVSHDAIMYWSNNFETTEHPVALDGVVISDNQIRIRTDRTEYPRRSARAIWFYGGTRAVSVKNVKISGNQILYPEDAAYFEKRNIIGRLTGIGWQLKPDQVALENVSIEGNTISHAPSAAIRIGEGRLGNLSIVGNTILSPCINMDASQALTDRYGIFLSATLTRPVTIAGNVISLEAERGPRAIYYLRARNSSDAFIEVTGNSYRFPQAKPAYLQAIVSNAHTKSRSLVFIETLPVAREDLHLPDVGPRGTGRITSSSHSATYEVPTGGMARWVAWYRARSSGGLPGQRGDTIVNSEPASGEPLSWHHTGREWRPGPRL
jgi:hypothetical protein